MPKVAVVTGANQGLGFTLIHKLGQTLGNQGTVYLTARDRHRGEAAVRQLQAEGLSPHFHLLDVTDDSSIVALADFLQQRHGGVDSALEGCTAFLGVENA
jgi:carbonyl reductase 1